MSEQDRSVELRGGSPWGFSIQGGADFRAPLKVTKVSPAGKAEMAGVHVNDVIKEICGKSSSTLRHSEALFLIRTAGEFLPLVLQKGGSSLAPYLPPKQLIRSSTAPAPRSPRKKISSPVKSPVVTPAVKETESVGSHDWYKAMHKSVSSEDERGPLSPSGEERRANPRPQPIKAKPRTVSLLTPANGAVTSPIDPSPSEDKTPAPPETGAVSADPPVSQEPAKEPATKKRSSKKKRELKPPPAESATGLYDFSAETKHELSFKRGDTLQLLRTVDQNWLEARLGAKKGIIPVSYVELTPQSATQPLVSGPQAVAKFDFMPEESYELGFHKGDTIHLLARVDDNWLQGRLADTTGIFPAAFVNILVPIEVSPANRNLPPVENEIRTPVLPESPRVSSQGEGDLHRVSSQGEGDLHRVSSQGEGDLHRVSSQGEGDLHRVPSQGEGDMHRVSSQGEGDLHRVPSQGEGDMHHVSSQGEGDLHRVPSQGEGDLHRALYAYSPQNADELGLEPGTEVHVIRKCEDGWFMGYHGVTGAFGTFPGNYVQLV